ncbi:MAG TPA: aldehyde dehydrogenase family protein [Acidimicrobiales bacterium]|jgi:betaine-aldehyde dehydrogenase|nr:aldehyde dehydrogenase family protein [Acidimicrobiales bacterium]
MSENTLTVVDPATEKPIAELPLGGAEAVDVAVAQATRAFPAWRAVSPSDRARLMRRFATAVEESAEELAQLETANVGKPISDSRDEVAMVAEVLHFYAGAVDKHRGATVPVAGGVDLTFNEPLGVVAAIVPWNFPLAITSWKVGPALATGNTVVVKPAELTPLTALRLEALALEAGIPPGVLQVVVGTGPVAGGRLAQHPDVAKVAFTGSTAVGREIMATASRTIKRVTLELGGKSASIVFADADVERAAAAAPGGVFANSGQDCCARSRILVERSVFDRFLELLAEAVGAWRVGDPRRPDTQMGPLVSSNRRAAVGGYLAAGMGDPRGGAVEPAISGSLPDGPGFWFPPTVVAPAENHWRLASEEIFGPVVAVIPFDGEEEAVRLANDTPYGLSGSIWTRDGAKALRTARAVEAGNLSVNSNGSVRVQTSFGGMKQSGFGRELGLEALGAYSEVKNVFYSTEP